jgi:hypothetical protein
MNQCFFHWQWSIHANNSESWSGQLARGQSILESMERPLMDDGGQLRIRNEHHICLTDICDGTCRSLDFRIDSFQRKPVRSKCFFSLQEFKLHWVLNRRATGVQVAYTPLDRSTSLELSVSRPPSQLRLSTYRLSAGGQRSPRISINLAKASCPSHLRNGIMVCMFTEAVMLNNHTALCNDQSWSHLPKQYNSKPGSDPRC